LIKKFLPLFLRNYSLGYVINSFLRKGRPPTDVAIIFPVKLFEILLKWVNDSSKVVPIKKDVQRTLVIVCLTCRGNQGVKEHHLIQNGENDDWKAVHVTADLHLNVRKPYAVFLHLNYFIQLLVGFMALETGLELVL